MRIRLARLLLIVAVAAATLAPAPLRANALDAVSPGDRGEIRRVIEAQIAAFRRDDGPAAFSFASPSIRSMFRTAETFMGMVKSGYRPVYRPREVNFLDMVDQDGSPAQRVFLLGPEGEAVVAVYVMERQPDGAWRIAGCLLTKASEA
jgi:hypothetical protein